MAQVDSNKVKNATKWSSITEIVAKLINPITSMVLARLLTPEAFGVVATISIVISFSEIFADAGFQKYLIQHEFKDEREHSQHTTVAFWSNLFVSCLIWLSIALFRNDLAEVVGCSGLGNVLMIACISIPLTGFSSIQSALFKRDFDFKTLFYVRMAALMVPLLITIPLAVMYKKYWALIIGTISSNIVNAVILTSKSKWKPTLYYSFQQLKEMLSFTIWTIAESILVWLTLYLDLFIVGKALDSYYLGLYRTSISIVNQVTNIVVGILVPVLFSALSRYQNDKQNFDNTYFKFQKSAALLIFPMSVGIYVYSDLITSIMLGGQWGEAAGFVGLWGLLNAPVLVFSQFAGEAYRAKGKPNIASLSQILHLIAVVPVVIVCIRYGFETLYIGRSLVRIEAVFVNIILLAVYIEISPLKMLKNLMSITIASLLMGLVGYYIRTLSDGVAWQFVSIFICIVLYFGFIYLVPSERENLLDLKSIIKK